MDPYKYSDYSIVDHSEPLQQAQPGPFHYIIDDNDGDEHHHFDFDDILPFLVDNDNDDDPAVHYHEANEEEEGDIDSLLPAPAQPEEDKGQPPILRPISPADQRRRVTMPQRPLSDEGGEDEGAEVWQTPATLDVQREFYMALLDKIDNYTSAAEVTQQTLQSLALTQQQRVQAEIQKRGHELQEQLEWAEKALDPQAISKAKLECAF
jgi:hypothetical protein